LERITIIGLRPVGVSLGLALKRAGLASTEIVGTDGDRKALDYASNSDAVDETTGNLRRALDGAQLVVIDMPIAQTRELLEAIGPVLETGCVVVDISLAQGQVAALAQEHLPDTAAFVGGRPLPWKPLTSLDDAGEDVFDGTFFCVLPSRSADENSVKTVVGLVEMLGATPLFMDAAEHDSYSAAVSFLPTVLSSALVNATSASPSWKDISRLAGQEFAEASRLASDDPKESGAMAAALGGPLVHWIDRMIAGLGEARKQLADANPDIESHFVRAWEERAKWEAGGVGETKGVDMPSAAQTMAGVVLSNRMVERYRQISESKRKAPWEYPGRQGY